jgi:TctA family transporter
MLENYFITTMISSGGRLTAFVDRPIAAVLALTVAALWLLPLLKRALGRKPVPVPHAEREEVA